MATQSRVIWDNGHPESPATVTIFWDDVTLFLTRVEIDNTQGLQPLHVSATVLKNGRTFDRTVAVGDTLNQNIPTNQANRLELFINQKGFLDGVDWSIS